MVSAQVREIGRAMGAFAAETTSKLAIESIRELRKSTPRDTGFAAASWVAQIGSGNPTGILAPSNRAERALRVPAALAQGEASIIALGAYRIEAGPIFVTSNVHYVPWLDMGTRFMAPRNFIRPSMERARKRVERQLRGRRGFARVPGAARSPFSGRFTAT